METHLFQLQYAIDTFYFLICGSLVMWMAAGFAMLESGLVRTKNTTEILIKNIALYAMACTMYLVCGYAIMYDGAILLSGTGQTETAAVLNNFADREGGFEGAAIYSTAADFFFQVVFVATAMSIVSGAVAERMKLWAFLAFSVVMTGVIYPLEGAWTWGGKDVFGLYNLASLSFSDFAGSGIVHLAGAAAALAGYFWPALSPGALLKRLSACESAPKKNTKVWILPSVVWRPTRSLSAASSILSAARPPEPEAWRVIR